MNNKQRKELAAAAERISGLTADLEDLTDILTEHQEEEQDKFDNMNDGLQASERGQATEAAATALQEAIDALQEAMTNLETATDAIDTATE